MMVCKCVYHANPTQGMVDSKFFFKADKQKSYVYRNFSLMTNLSFAVSISGTESLAFATFLRTNVKV